MKRTYLTWGTAALALVAAAQPAWAQGDNDIIVTARRVEERLQDVPISITAFTQQQLTNRNIVSAGDIAIYTPSLSANSRFGPEKTSFSIRGFNQDNGTAPSVGVYFADAPALRSIGSTTTGNGAGPGAYFDLANLQVLKGPQGTLFGRNTSGGAVLLIPQKPTGRLEGYVEGSVGNYDLRRIQAVVNIPVLDTLRIRIGVDRQTRDGFMKNVSGIGPGDFNDIDYWAARFSAVADLTPNLENYFIASYSKSTTNGFLPRVFACDRAGAAAGTLPSNELAKLACAQVDRSNNRGFYTGENVLPNPYQNIQQWQVINTTTWKATDNLTVKNIISYGEFREALRGTVYGEDLIINTGPDAGKHVGMVESNPSPGRNSAALSTFTEELQFQGTLFDSRLTWQAGVYLEIASPLGFAGANNPSTGWYCATENNFACTSFRPSAATTPTGTGSVTINPSLSTSVNKYAFQDYAAYAQATYKLSDHFSVTGGVRYTRDNYQATTRFPQFTPIVNNAISPGYVTGFQQTGTCRNVFVLGTASGRTEAQCETYTRAHSSAPTWLIDVDYKPTEDVLLYAKYARGYRQGQIKADGFGREAFNPEKIEAYEIGLKTSWRGPVRGTFNVAGFYNDLSNQQIATSGIYNVPGLTPAQLITNAGKSRLAGVEVDSSINPFQGFTIDVGYAYLDTKVKSISPPPGDAVFSSFVPSSAGLNLPITLAPKNKYTITGTYVLPLPDSVGKVAVSATFTHTDSYEATYQTYPCQFGPCSGRGALGYDIGRVPAYELLNLNLNWNSVAGGPVDLSVFATNVTNKQYYVATFGGYTSFGFESMAVGEPRMYGVRLKYRFGD
ncbi:MAG TPA: TonB-dependent receptor [Sphingobium sp.]|uniref:TonB-dependent receptor n=1 Tax=Sphingobium sp. TaxID=1912891 RepID=UPI002ED054C2